MDVGKKIFGAIVNLLDYDKQIPGCGMGDTVWIMKHKKGKCDDYHALFMAMMISQGIPVRWEQGFPLPYSSQDSRASGKLSGDCSGAHCWASFFVPEVGWVPVDVSEADKHPDLSSFFFGNLTPNRFKISEGRSIILNPSQGAQPLSTFAFAYAEADGIPLIYQSNYENVVAFDIKKVET
jgi:transglutaminase-like putative cysteine protease